MKQTEITSKLKMTVFDFISICKLKLPRPETLETVISWQKKIHFKNQILKNSSRACYHKFWIMILDLKLTVKSLTLTTNTCLAFYRVVELSFLRSQVCKYTFQRINWTIFHQFCKLYFFVHADKNDEVTLWDFPETNYRYLLLKTIF